MATHAGDMDPAEAAEELRALTAVPEGLSETESRCLVRHQIDAFLGRHRRSVLALWEGGPRFLSRAVEVARQRGCLRELAWLAAGGGQGDGARDRVLREYGNWLASTSKAEDAAVVLAGVGAWGTARAAHGAAGDWRMAMVDAAREGLSADALRGVAARTVEQLEFAGVSGTGGRLCSCCIT